jgi:hypothetical protein
VSIGNALVSVLPEPRRLLSSLGGCVHSLDQDLLVVPIRLTVVDQAIVIGGGTNAGPFCAFEDMGDEGDDLRFRLHCPSTVDNSVRAFLVPSNDTWNLRLDGSGLESGYLDFLVDDAVADGTLEGYVVIRKRPLDYTAGSYSSGAVAAAPTARSLRLTERTLFPVQAAMEDVVFWAASVSVDDTGAVSSARAPSALAAVFAAGDLTIDSVAFAEPNVMFGGLAKETASLSATGSDYRVVRGDAADFAIVDGDGALLTDIDSIVYTTVEQRVVVAALQSGHGQQAEWARGYLLTDEDIATRTAAEVGYALRSAWKRACLIPLSVTLDVNSVITAATLCPGVRVYSGDTGTEAHIYIDFGAAPADGLTALAIHRATGQTYPIVETGLSTGVLRFAVDVSVNLGVFDILILAHLDSER